MIAVKEKKKKKYTVEGEGKISDDAGIRFICHTYSMRTETQWYQSPNYVHSYI